MIVLIILKAEKTQLPSIAERASDIYRAGGFRAFFAGLVPRTLWISAGGSVFLGVYEFFVAASFLAQHGTR
jgi:solute carrier family 25 S-adenosylmethionine transporter 26